VPKRIRAAREEEALYTPSNSKNDAKISSEMEDGVPSNSPVTSDRFVGAFSQRFSLLFWDDYWDTEALINSKISFSALKCRGQAPDGQSLGLTLPCSLQF
jgi:hypothetical protein